MIKKIIKLIIVIIFILIGYKIIQNNDLNKYINKTKEKVDVIQNKTKDIDIYKLIDNDEIDKDFFKWIINNFNVTNKLKKILNKQEYSKSIWKEVTGYSYNSLKSIYENKLNKTDIETNTTISFIGDVSLADNWSIMPAYDERNKGVKGILSDEVINILSTSTMSVANNEFTISDRGNPLAGKTYTFRGNKTRLNIYNEMGIDLVTLANNHVYDYGLDAFNDLLDALDEFDMPHIGAGHNINEATKEYSIILNGYKISFINATRAEKNILTPGASETEAGVFRCYDSTLLEQRIKEVKENSDYVIALVHFGKEGYHDLEEEQVASSKRYIDSGADAVIGTHAHTLQGIEYYNGKLIAYNLGDFIFNGKTEDTAILTLSIDQEGLLNYTFIPCLQSNMYTKTLDGEEKQRIINNMNSWNINACINNFGIVSEGTC